MEKKHYKTVVLSDIHLGSKWSKGSEVSKFMENNSCDTLILCGNVIDKWNLKSGKKHKWNIRHANFIRMLYDIPTETEIIYLQLDCNESLNKNTLFQFRNIRVVKNPMYANNDKSYYILRGEISEKTISQFGRTTKLSHTWNALFSEINKIMLGNKNHPHYLSKGVIDIIKLAVLYMDKFEKYIMKIAHENNYDGIINEYTNHFKELYYTGVLQSTHGCQDSFSVLTEDIEGCWEVIAYTLEKKCEKNNQNILTGFAV